MQAQTTTTTTSITINIDERIAKALCWKGGNPDAPDQQALAAEYLRSHALNCVSDYESMLAATVAAQKVNNEVEIN